MILLRLFLIVLAGSLIACQSGSKDTETDHTQNETQTLNPSKVSSAAQGTGGQVQAPEPGSPYAGLTSISIQEMHDLYYSCNSVDIIFYDTNFSLSQTDTNQIRTTLEYLLPSPVLHNPACKPRGRITFWVDGELSHEADIYLGDNCNYFVWMDGSKPRHINPLNPRGVDFFTKILAQGNEIFKQQQSQNK